MSLMKTAMIERMYDKPNIKNKRRIIGIGNNIIEKFGINWKIGINPKKTATSTKDNKPIAVVNTTGKNSFRYFIDLIIPALLVKLVRPPDVPREKM